jgi:hypothetical protein
LRFKPPAAAITATPPPAGPPAEDSHELPRKAKKKKKKAKKPAGLFGRLSPPVLIVGAIGAAVFVGVIVTAVLLSRGRSGAGGAAAAGAKGDFVVVDSPVEGVQGPAALAPPPPAPPRPPAKIVPLRADGAAAAEPGWVMRPDPPAAAPAAPSELWGVLAAEYPPPQFASLGGPFVGVRAGAAPTGLVLDLRTGKQAGTFPIIFHKGRLSPDGQYLVSGSLNPMPDLTNKEGKLPVYSQKSQQAKEPDATIEIPGNVAWIDFVAADRVAVYTFNPKPVLHVHTVRDGKLVKAIPVQAEMFPPPEPPPNLSGPHRPKYWYDPRDLAGAVSPGGRYVVLGGKKGLVVFSMPEGRQLTELPVSDVLDWNSYNGVSFSPDGAELYCVHVDKKVVTRLQGWSLATGRVLFNVPLSFRWFGPPLPGPVPGTMILPGGGANGFQGPTPGVIVDTAAGLLVHTLFCSPYRWAGPDTLLAYGSLIDAPHVKPPPHVRLPDKEKLSPKDYEIARANALRGIHGVYTTRFDRAAYRAKAAPVLASVAPRPPAAVGDRKGLKPLKPEPPAGWTAPPAARPPEPSAAKLSLPAWPAALTPAHAAVITFDFERLPRFQYSVNWHRYDLRAGKKEGAKLQLWPWAEMSTRHVTMIEKFPTPPTALTDDGRLLALRDPADPARVDVWDADGKRLAGMVPYGQGVAVEWLGWSGDGRLLTLAGGRLTGWDWKATRAVWEVEGGYARPVAQPPGGAWVAAPAGDAVDLLDAGTGRCLARCKAPPGDAYLALAVAPDGKALAAARPEKRPAPQHAFTADVWDLTDGKVASVSFGEGKFEFLHWSTPDHLLACSRNLDLIDRRAGTVVGVYGYSPRVRARDGPQILAGAPDGRVWALFDTRVKIPETGGTHVWRPQALPDPKGDVERLLLAAGREYLRPTAGPLRVEVDVGDATRSRDLGRKLATELQARGFTIGPKGMALRLSHRVQDSTLKLTLGGLGGDGAPVPEVRYAWQLLTADGAVAWETATQGRFLQQGSKYFTKTKHERGLAGPGMGGSRTDFYDFRGQSMRSAVVEEILEGSANLTLPPGAPPPLLIRAGREYRPLPVGREVRLDAGS